MLNNPTYTKDKVTGAEWYYLYVSGTPSDVFAQQYSATNVCSASTCSVTSATTLGAGAYTWWVQTWNEGGYGPWSTSRNFSVP